MLEDYIAAHKLIGRFAVVKLWPELKTAEDECIARFKIAAKALGLECVEIHPDGRLLDNPTHTISKNDVDFVLHLHYDTPKLYDAFSLVALWNPVNLYHQWGYARCSRNLLSHDDFISCSSDPADHHVGRLIRKSANHLPPLFNIYHSLSDILYPPTLGDRKLVYVGINWDALSKGVSRHQALLKSLDDSGALRIYGPALFQGVKVWNGYKSYVKEIPFDGISIVKEINQAGISLVLSSEIHKQSQLMSNRLFESIAAGALVICDENPFARKFFGDALLYIDTRSPVEEIKADIFNHMEWANKNPDAAIAMIKQAQQIFKDKFSLNRNLQDLYTGLPERKRKLQEMNRVNGDKSIKVSINFLMPVYDETILQSYITGIAAQDYDNFKPTLVIDKAEAEKNNKQLRIALTKSSVQINILEVDYFTYGKHQDSKRRRKTGEVIMHILNNLPTDIEAVTFVAPNEQIFSNHLGILAGSLARNPDTGCAATAAIFKQLESLHGNQETIDFSQLDPMSPIGYGRFIFRVSKLATDIHLALPYLDRKALAVLIDENKVCQEAPATIIIDTAAPFPHGDWDEGQENELINSYCPTVFALLTGFEIKLPSLSYGPQHQGIKLNENIKWIIRQINALRRQGLSARIHVLKTKFKQLATL